MWALMLKPRYINPCDAETKFARELVNTMAADALTPSLTRLLTHWPL